MRFFLSTILLFVATEVLVMSQKQALGISVSDLKAYVCCTHYSGGDTWGNCDDSEQYFDQYAKQLDRGEQVSTADGSPCNCTQDRASTIAIYLGEENRTLLFDQGTDGEADLEIDIDTLQDKDKFELSSCSDCNGTDSVCENATSYVAFRVPVGVLDPTTVATTTATSQNDSSSTLSGAGKFGIVVLVFAVVGLLVFLLYRHLSKGRDQEDRTNQQDHQRTLLPIKYRRYIFLGLIMLTWVLWNVAIFHCTFMAVGDKDVDYKDRRNYGIFSFARYDGGNIYTCGAYSPDTIDDFEAGENASRFFGAFGYTMHTIVLLMILGVEICCQYQRIKLLWLVARILLIVSLVCSLLIFSFYGQDVCSDGDDVICAPGAAGIVAIFNIVFMVVLVAVSWLTAPPANPFLSIGRWQEGDQASSPWPDYNIDMNPAKAMQEGDAPGGPAAEPTDTAHHDISDKPYEEEPKAMQEGDAPSGPTAEPTDTAHHDVSDRPYDEEPKAVLTSMLPESPMDPMDEPHIHHCDPSDLGSPVKEEGEVLVA